MNISLQFAKFYQVQFKHYILSAYTLLLLHIKGLVAGLLCCDRAVAGTEEELVYGISLFR